MVESNRRASPAKDAANFIINNLSLFPEAFSDSPTVSMHKCITQRFKLSRSAAIAVVRYLKAFNHPDISKALLMQNSVKMAAYHPTRPSKTKEIASSILEDPIKYLPEAFTPINPSLPISVNNPPILSLLSAIKIHFPGISANPIVSILSESGNPDILKVLPYQRSRHRHQTLDDRMLSIAKHLSADPVFSELVFSYKSTPLQVIQTYLKESRYHATLISRKLHDLGFFSQYKSRAVEVSFNGRGHFVYSVLSDEEKKAYIEKGCPRLNRDYTLISAIPKSANEPFTLRCKSCGNEFPSYFRQYPKILQCTFCNKEVSQYQGQLESFIKGLAAFDVIRNYLKNDRSSFLEGREIDIYLPDLKIGFEINGLYTHHSGPSPYSNEPQKQPVNGIPYHKWKSDVSLKHGILLFHINHLSPVPSQFDAIIRSIIVSKLGLSHKVYARSTQVFFSRAYSKDIQHFLNVSHLNGYAPANFFFYLKDSLGIVAVLSFRFPRSRGFDKSSIEIARLAFRLNYSVVGGFAKLLKEAIRFFKLEFPSIRQIYTY